MEKSRLQQKMYKFASNAEESIYPKLWDGFIGGWNMEEPEPVTEKTD